MMYDCTGEKSGRSCLASVRSLLAATDGPLAFEGQRTGPAVVEARLARRAHAADGIGRVTHVVSRAERRPREEKY